MTGRHTPRTWRCDPLATEDVWCTVHGDCLCPRFATGERITSRAAAPGCPLHGDDTDHPHGEVFRS